MGRNQGGSRPGAGEGLRTEEDSRPWKKRRPGFRFPAVKGVYCCWMLALDRADDLAEHIADGGTKDRQNNDNHDGDQNEDQSIFHQALAFLLQFLEHRFFLLSSEIGKSRTFDCLLLSSYNNI
jgi:hypothetical protein